MARIEITTEVRTGKTVKQLEKCTEAAKRLKAELDRLKDYPIEVKTVSRRKRWWEWW